MPCKWSLPWPVLPNITDDGLLVIPNDCARLMYDIFNREWEAKFGWKLFLPPHKADSHLIKTLRVPISESQVEFEQQALTLARLLVDFINEADIGSQLKTHVDHEKGISKFGRWLIQEGFDATVLVISTLRRIQRLRTKMSAHRKGSDFEKILSEMEISDSPLVAVANLLWEAIAILEAMANFFDLDLRY